MNYKRGFETYTWKTVLKMEVEEPINKMEDVYKENYDNVVKA